MAHKRSSAAYARADVADARRGAPEGSLDAWAKTRGLESMGSSLPGAFSSVMPTWAEYVFNLSRGTLAGGRYGYLAHELEEIGLDGKGSPRVPGGYHSLRVFGKGRGLRSHLFGIDKARPNEPFAAESVWLPTTAVGVRVPEAATLGPVTIRPSSRFPVGGNPKLDDAGLPGFRIAGGERPDDLRLAVGAAARPLATLKGEYVALRLSRGVVGVRVNGFVSEEARLDQLVAVAGEIGDALAALAAPTLVPQAFSTPLPPPDPASWPFGIPAPQPFETDALRRLSVELAMTLEDPIAFHRTAPRCPVPGRALGVLHGALPGTSATGRLGVFDQGGNTGGTYRSAVMVSARPEASTPLGGTLDPGSDLYVEVADGVAYAWPRNRTRGAFDAAPTIARALPTLRSLGLADL